MLADPNSQRLTSHLCSRAFLVALLGLSPFTHRCPRRASPHLSPNAPLPAGALGLAERLQVARLSPDRSSSFRSGKGVFPDPAFPSSPPGLSPPASHERIAVHQSPETDRCLPIRAEPRRALHPDRLSTQLEQTWRAAQSASVHWRSSRRCVPTFFFSFFPLFLLQTERPVSAGFLLDVGRPISTFVAFELTLLQSLCRPFPWHALRADRSTTTRPSPTIDRVVLAARCRQLRPSPSRRDSTEPSRCTGRALAVAVSPSTARTRACSFASAHRSSVSHRANVLFSLVSFLIPDKPLSFCPRDERDIAFVVFSLASPVCVPRFPPRSSTPDAHRRSPPRCLPAPSPSLSGRASRPATSLVLFRLPSCFRHPAPTSPPASPPLLPTRLQPATRLLPDTVGRRLPSPSPRYHP